MRDDVRRWREAVGASDLKPGTRLVLERIALYLDRKTMTAWPSQKRLAAETGLSVRTVKAHLGEASERGFLVKERSRALFDESAPARARRSQKGRGGVRIVYRAQVPIENEPLPATGTDEFALWPEAAKLIRAHLWLGDQPPPQAPRGWSMARERSVWRQLAREHGPEQVNAAIPHVRAVFGLDRQPATLALLNARRSRLKLVDAVQLGMKQLLAENGAARVGERSIMDAMADLAL